MVRFTSFRSYLRSPFKTASTTSHPSPPTPKAFRNQPAPRPLDIAMNEPIMSTFEPNFPASPITQDLPHGNMPPPPPSPLHSTTNDTETTSEPRVFTINITNLTSPSSPLPSPSPHKKTSNALLRTRSRRRLSTRISKLSPSRGAVVQGNVPPVPAVAAAPRPNSFFGAGFDIPVAELEKVVEEVNEMSLRCARQRGVEGELGRADGRRGGGGVAYVRL